MNNVAPKNDAKRSVKTKRKNIIFLDVDGVLNSKKFIKRQKYFNVGNNNFIDESRLPLLKSLVEQTGAQIVLSSSWRHDPYAVRGLKSIMSKYGLVISGRTNIQGNNRSRGDEILEWLQQHPDTHSFVILDDVERDMGPLSARLIQTDAYESGLSDEDIKLAVQMINNPNTFVCYEDSMDYNR